MQIKLRVIHILWGRGYVRMWDETNVRFCFKTSETTVTRYITDLLTTS